MSPRGLLSVAPLIFIILVCVPTSLGKPTADRDVPETFEESVTLLETIEDNEESTTIAETIENNERSTTIAETIEESATLAETIEESATTAETIEESATLAETESSEEVGGTFTHTTFNLRSKCRK